MSRRDWRSSISSCVSHAVDIGSAGIENLDEALPAADFTRLPLPSDAGFLAGKAFMRYRHARGSRLLLPRDFYIGARAAIWGLSLVTRDAARYRIHFSNLPLICPDADADRGS